MHNEHQIYIKLKQKSLMFTYFTIYTVEVRKLT
jgi:hypothetical protein